MANPAAGWHCLTLAVPLLHAEVVSAWCFELGSCGLELEEAGEVSQLKAYFADSLGLEEMRRELGGRLAGLGLTATPLQVGRVEPQDWEQEWRRFFQPVWATPRIVIHPSWIPVEPGPGQVAVVIDPKMAFGTGGHESTQLGLELLDQLLASGEVCLDLGTGSGILGIAAGLLGAGDLTLVDTDPLALENAGENLGRNGVKARLLQGSIEAAAGREYDLVLANIQSSVLVPMLGAVAVVLRPGGRVVFSGLLDREEKVFCRAVASAGLGEMEVRRRGEWIAVAARRA